jgi:hypothetical protein
MRIIAFVTSAPALASILSHLGHPKPAPDSIPGGPGRDPQLWDQAPEPVPDWYRSPA